MLRSCILFASTSLLIGFLLGVTDVGADVTRWCPAGDGGVVVGGPPVNRTVDRNGDGTVNVIDAAWFAMSYSTASTIRPYDMCADFNNDGLNSLPDFSFFAFHYGHAGAVVGFCN